MAKIVALLESMWGWGGYNSPGETAPRSFTINPDNVSGRRLYRLCGNHRLLVTNCCRTVQATANDHGMPDKDWVRENINFLRPFDLLLVCGRIAKVTYDSIGCEFGMPVLYIDHPAARRWTNVKFDATAKEIERLCRG